MVGSGLEIIYFVLNCIAGSLVIPLVLMVTACFCGWSIILNTKRVYIIGIVVVVLTMSWYFIPNIIMSIVNPKLYEAMFLGNLDESMRMSYRILSGYINDFMMLLFYVFGFFVYWMSYQEKKILRALCSCVVSFLFCQYESLLFVYIYVYITGGKWDSMQQVIYGMGPECMMANLFRAAGEVVLLGTWLAVLYYGYYRKKRFYVIKVRKIIGLGIWLIFVVAAQYVVFGMGGYNMADRYTIMSIWYGWMLLALGLIAPLFWIFDEARKYLSKQNMFQQHYLEAELDYIARYKESQNETRAFRHDIINHLSLANMLMETGKTDEAMEHVRELLGNVQGLSPQFVTGDEMLDCIVSMKAEKMKGKGIAFSADGVVDGGLSMKPMEICSIFANALDNSIEAASQTKDPKVSMKIKRTEKFFVIDIENSVNQKVNVNKLLKNEGYTSKKDKEYHGFGLRNIQSSVEKNEGMLKITSTDDTFLLSIMLPRNVKAS